MALPPPPDVDSVGWKDWLYRFYKQGSGGGGTWTPAITFATPGNLSVAYTYQVGDYIINGSFITLFGLITTSSFTHTTASGNLKITGIPRDASTAKTMVWNGTCGYQGITKASYTGFFPVMSSTAPTFLQMNAGGSAQNIDFVTAADMPTTGLVSLRFQITYGI